MYQSILIKVISLLKIQPLLFSCSMPSTQFQVHLEQLSSHNAIQPLTSIHNWPCINQVHRGKDHPSFDRDVITRVHRLKSEREPRIKVTLWRQPSQWEMASSCVPSADRDIRHLYIEAVACQKLLQTPWPGYIASDGIHWEAYCIP